MTFEVPGTPAHDLQGTLQQSLNDLVEVKQWLPGVNVHEAERAADILDRLSEEMAEAAAMTRALPGRPPDQTGHTFAAAAAFTTAVRIEPDFARWLAAVLADVARQPGTMLTASPPGSWNAWLLRQLIEGLPAALPDTQTTRVPTASTAS
ncbi:MAG TPA: hypothetical protein VMV07_12210 [Streptosporangiaceae bacterium]|nr:hypothetical protein [Streptosporangiaceae bacterium]